jgi:hypothetical protein
MLNLGLIGFTQPWLLAAFVLLPALWWLLRIIPPAPQLVRFPAVRFLLGIDPEEETSARTPLWLLLLRLLLAALLILALSGPIWNPEPDTEGDGPLVLVVDDGWAAFPGWQQRLLAMERLTERAVRQNREVVLLGTAPDPVDPVFRRFGAADALPSITSWQPKPWPTKRELALDKLQSESRSGRRFHRVARRAWFPCRVVGASDRARHAAFPAGCERDRTRGARQNSRSRPEAQCWAEGDWSRR